LGARQPRTVMAGLVLAIHAAPTLKRVRRHSAGCKGWLIEAPSHTALFLAWNAWMAGTSPAKTACGPAHH
jgi:hypothetical protein